MRIPPSHLFAVGCLDNSLLEMQCCPQFASDLQAEIELYASLVIVVCTIGKKGRHTAHVTRKDDALLFVIWYLS